MNQELIEKYVAGQLGEAEAEAFEDYCVANPEFARLVEHEQRLRVGIAQVATGSTAEFAAPNYRRPWYLAAAAAALVAIVAGLYGWIHSAGVQASPILAAVAHDGRAARETLRLARIRGSETMPVLQPRPVRIEIVGLFDVESDYTLTLDRRATADEARADETRADELEIVSTLDGLHPASSTSLEVTLDGSRLQPGAYSLRVSRRGSSDEALEFGFVRR
jgi:hypothetical protein